MLILVLIRVISFWFCFICIFNTKKTMIQMKFKKIDLGLLTAPIIIIIMKVVLNFLLDF